MSWKRGEKLSGHYSGNPPAQRRRSALQTEQGVRRQR